MTKVVRTGSKLAKGEWQIVIEAVRIQSPPNILWIVTTQWRGQACGYAGDPNARTPHLDALAARSVNYAQAVTPHPFGPMARAALLTGVASPENGVREYFDALPTDARTIAHEMRERGYTTAFFGKWGVGKRDPSVPLVGEAAARVIVPESERGGFEAWEGFEGGFLLNDPWLQGTAKDLVQPTQVRGYQSDVLVGRALAWCERVGGGKQPWFGVLSLEAPHPPYDTPAAGVVPSDPAGVVLAKNVPLGGDVEAKARRELSGYYAHIEATDRAIGALLNAVAEEVVVVFTSVHGDLHGAHGLFRKGWPDEEAVRVPLLVRRPGVVARRDDGAISLVDLAAMTRAWAEGGEAFVTRSHSLISMPSVVALPHQGDRSWRGVRTPTRKLVLDERGEPWRFFDLEQDPLEMKNLVGEPARRGEIAELGARAGLG
jgi:hypothetical protein